MGKSAKTFQRFLISVVFASLYLWPLILPVLAQRTPILTATERSLRAKYEAIKGGMTLRQVAVVMGRRHTEHDDEEGVATWGYGENVIAVQLLFGKVVSKVAFGGHFDQMSLKEVFQEEVQKQSLLAQERNKGITSYDGVLVTTGSLEGKLLLSEKFEEIRDGMTTAQVLAVLGQPNTAVKGIAKRGAFKGKRTFAGIWNVGDGVMIKILFLNNKVIESEM